MENRVVRADGDELRAFRLPRRNMRCYKGNCIALHWLGVLLASLRALTLTLTLFDLFILILWECVSNERKGGFLCRDGFLSRVSSTSSTVQVQEQGQGQEQEQEQEQEGG